MTPAPNPGSQEARDRDCKCPVLDNAHGRGAWGSEGDDAVFWIAAECVLHGTTGAPAKWTASA